MENIQIDNLIYLTVLGVAVAGWFIAENRQGLGKTMRMAVAWGLIFMGFIAAYGLWEDVRTDLVPRQTVLADGHSIELPRQSDGPFHAVVGLNGRPLGFLVDTGATDVVLTPTDARQVGIDVDNLAFLGSASTANGIVKIAYERVDDISIGPFELSNFPVAINSAEMGGSLLGMSFLSQFDKIEIEGNSMTLIP